MGREVKRVPLDFKWPMKTIWGGYLNPFYKQCIDCPECNGSGSSPEATHLKNQWYGNASFNPEERGSKPFLPTHEKIRWLAERNVKQSPGYYGDDAAAIDRESNRLANHFNSGWSNHLNSDDIDALIKKNRLRDFTHTWTKETGWKIKEPAYIPSPEEVNDWSLMGLGHDACNKWVCVNAECDRLGYPTTCKACDGEGTIWPNQEIKQQAEEYQNIEPPAGDGWQMWETTSEGSPMSPVFSTPEELATWLYENEASSFGSNTSSYEQWLKFIKGPGWAPSAFLSDDGLKAGIELA